MSRLCFVCSYFVLLVVCLYTELTQAQTEELVSTMPEATQSRMYAELYSENNIYNSDVAVTDSRLRQYFSFVNSENSSIAVEAFLGANWQAQLSDSETRYLTNAVSPSLGVRGNWRSLIYLNLEERYRFEYETENPQHVSDPRFVISGGQFLPWDVTKAKYLFTEFYGEASWVYRVDPAPVSTVWVKQGYRVPVSSQLYIDPYVEFYSRQSSNDNLGTNLNEGRAGGRLLFTWQKFSAAAHVYQPIASLNNSLAGLFVVGGVF
jgi:hypothetical protein